jgi:hypothetical protein
MDKITEKRINALFDGIHERVEKLKLFILEGAASETKPKKVTKEPGTKKAKRIAKEVSETPAVKSWMKKSADVKKEAPATKAAKEPSGELLASYKDGAWFCKDGRHKDFHGVRINEMVAHLISDHGLPFDEIKDRIEEFTHARRYQAKQFLIKEGLMTEGGKTKKIEASIKQEKSKAKPEDRKRRKK